MKDFNMPIYEFVCEECGNVLEFMVAMSKKPKKVKCDKCKGNCVEHFGCKVRVPNPVNEHRRNRGRGTMNHRGYKG